MFPITLFDGGRRARVDDSTESVGKKSVMVSSVRDKRTPSRTTAELVEAYEAVISWSETIEHRPDTELILHS